MRPISNKFNVLSVGDQCGHRRLVGDAALRGPNQGGDPNTHVLVQGAVVLEHRIEGFGLSDRHGVQLLFRFLARLGLDTGTLFTFILVPLRIMSRRASEKQDVGDKCTAGSRRVDHRVHLGGRHGLPGHRRQSGTRCPRRVFSGDILPCGRSPVRNGRHGITAHRHRCRPALTWPPSSWSRTIDAAVVLTGVLVVPTIAGMIQARAMTALRHKLIANPRDNSTAVALRRVRLLANGIRGLMALMTLAIVILAAFAVAH